ncbi:MAG: hypothetical protein ACREJC_19805, partial [Tepidisphaeraceae bacterium]
MMDAFKAQLSRIQEQLGSLSASQKMLTASLIAVMVLTLMWWGRYAATAEMEPLLDQSLKGDAISQITARLSSRGVRYRVDGDRVLVSADRRAEALGDLGYQQLLPADTSGSYDEILKRVSPWDSQSNSDAIRNEAKCALLADVIR